VIYIIVVAKKKKGFHFSTTANICHQEQPCLKKKGAVRLLLPKFTLKVIKKHAGMLRVLVVVQFQYLGSVFPF
jgi:hypothetical protein